MNDHWNHDPITRWNSSLDGTRSREYNVTTMPTESDGSKVYDTTYVDEITVILNTLILFHLVSKYKHEDYLPRSLKSKGYHQKTHNNISLCKDFRLQFTGEIDPFCICVP